MRVQEAARVMRRMASSIGISERPSRTAVAQDVSDLMAAIGGDREAAARLGERLPSGIPGLGQLEQAFRRAGAEPPEMRRVRPGVWAGRIKGVAIAVHASPDGQVQKVLVAGRRVRDWDETVEAARFFTAMQDDGSEEDPEDVEAATAELGSRAFKCVECGKPVTLDFDIACKGCGTEYVTCPGCEKPYPMEKNEDDHCPMCGYSSWSELPDDVAEAWTKILVEAAKKAAETRQPQQVDYQGFKATVEITDRGTGGNQMFIRVTSPEDMTEEPFEEWMEEPAPLVQGDLDSFLWKQSNTPMPPPEPIAGG